MSPIVRPLLLSLAVLALAACTPDSELSDRELYVKYCAECHGEDGAGDESLVRGDEGVNLLASQRIARGDRPWVRRRIANGYGQMPAYKHKVDEATLERLVDFTMRFAGPEDPTKADNPASEQSQQEESDGSQPIESRVPEAPGPG